MNTSQTKLDGTNEPKVNERKLRWDEENRLLAVDDNGFVSQYWYDADGERTVKTSGYGEAVYVNGLFSGGNTATRKFTLYVSPYLVASQGGRYTKHIYIGSQRIVSKLGDFASYGSDPRMIPYAGSESDNITVDYASKYQEQLQSIKDNYQYFEVPYNGVDNDDYVNGQGFCCDNPSGYPEGEVRNFDPGENINYEHAQFYYHPDHLGSSSFITNLDGDVTQHIEYVPFGEVFVEERNNVWNTPYLFNAKEFDEETGLYYYGARYYDSRVSLWISVDPLAHMRVSLSPYNYCSNNPINRVDPDGRLDDWVGTKNEDGTTTWTWDANITSQEQATAAGYDTYSKPGKIINTTGGERERVRLGEEGAIHTGIIGIHSNVGPDAGLTDGHAWISTSTVDGNLMNTYSLWPDEHPLFQGQDPSGNISDVRTDTELNAGYASASGNYSYYRYITKSQSNNLNGFIGTSDTWGYTHTCADWSRDAFKAATGIRLNVDDWFGLETPRKLSGTIIKLGANTPQTPATNENRNGSSR